MLLLEEKCTDERKGKKRPRESENGETSTNPDRLLPLKVRALYNGQMKEMKETSRGTWASVSWKLTNYITHFGQPQVFKLDQPPPPERYVAYQLIIESKDMIFAEGERQVLTHLSKLLDTQLMADVTFVVKNEQIGAHSAIVASGSPVICAMLEEDNFKESRTKTIQVDDIDPFVFKEMLHYLYTGRAPKLDEGEMTEPLFLAADKYQIKALKDLCEQSLITKLNMQTVIHYLVVAHLHSAPLLLEVSLKLLEKRNTKVWTRPEWKELNKSYPDLFFSASHRMFVFIMNRMPARFISFL